MGRNRTLGAPYQTEIVVSDVTTEHSVDAYLVVRFASHAKNFPSRKRTGRQNISYASPSAALSVKSVAGRM